MDDDDDTRMHAVVTALARTPLRSDFKHLSGTARLVSLCQPTWPPSAHGTSGLKRDPADSRGQQQMQRPHTAIGGANQRPRAPAHKLLTQQLSSAELQCQWHCPSNFNSRRIASQPITKRRQRREMTASLFRTEMSAKAAPEPLGVLRGHGAPVNSVSFLSASTIVSGAGDGAVKVWDLRSRRELTTNPTAHSKAGVLHATALREPAASEQKFVTQGRDGFVKLWDAQSFSVSAEPISEFYCGSYSFTKFATLRWPGDGDTAGSANLIVCPSSVDNKVSSQQASLQ
ncbi:unnamed protein product [Phytophthora fragariaefolia]|uniref:Unnamed protein product n=1 Tax=Phytophthora fragariaefolia TaxID=1490495 RepID=A0A9W6TPW2_9STRA|nr:unnamed protein product [Phytophthora fragariaefolia]